MWNGSRSNLTALGVGKKCLVRTRKLLHFALQGNAKCQKSPYKELLIYRLGNPYETGADKLCNRLCIPSSSTPEKEVTGEIPKAQSCIAYKTPTLTGMAQQHHHENLSQNTSQCSCSSDETQCHDPEPKHNSNTASQSVAKHHDQHNQTTCST